MLEKYQEMSSKTIIVIFTILFTIDFDEYANYNHNQHQHVRAVWVLIMKTHDWLMIIKTIVIMVIHDEYPSLVMIGMKYMMNYDTYQW